MSLSKGSKESTGETKEAATTESASKETAGESGIGESGIGQSAAKGSESKGTTGESGVSQQVLDKGEEMKDQNTKGDMSGAKGIAGKGENTRNAVGQGDTAGAESGHGLIKENVQKPAQEIGHRIFGRRPSLSTKESNDDIKKGPITHGRMDQRDTTMRRLSGAGGSGEGGLAQAAGSSATGGAVARGSGPGISFAGDNTSKGDTTARGMTGGAVGSKTARGYSTGDTVSAGSFTEDKTTKNRVGDNTTGATYTEGKPTFTDTDWGSKANAPGTKPSYTDTSKITGARDTLTGKALAGVSPSSGGGLSRSNATKGKPGSGMTGGAAAGGAGATDETIEHELSELSHISEDVFSSGAFNEDAAKGLSGGINMSHDPPGKSMSNIGKQKRGSKTTQASKGGISQGKGGFTQEPTSAGQTNKGLSDTSGLGMGAVGGGALAGGTMSSGGLGRDVTQGEMSRDTYGRGQFGTATTGMTDTSRAQPKRIVQNFSGNGNKATVLQDKVQAVSQKCKTQLGLSASEISKKGPTVDTFFDAVAAERLRWMPRDGSRLDCCLRWASRLAYAVDALRQSIGAFAPGADEAAKLIWGFEILLLGVRKSTSKIETMLTFLCSLILTTWTCLKASSADMAASLSTYICFSSMRAPTSRPQSFIHRPPPCMQTCSKWSVVPQPAVLKERRARSLNRPSLTMLTPLL
jgi:hypothetical protein